MLISSMSPLTLIIISQAERGCFLPFAGFLILSLPLGNIITLIGPLLPHRKVIAKVKPRAQVSLGSSRPYLDVDVLQAFQNISVQKKTSLHFLKTFSFSCVLVTWALTPLSPSPFIQSHQILLILVYNKFWIHPLLSVFPATSSVHNYICLLLGLATSWNHLLKSILHISQHIKE